MQQSFEPFAEFFTPTICKLIISSINFLSTAGHNCMLTIIQHTRSEKLLSLICKNASSPHNNLRQSCLEYLVVMLDSLIISPKYQDLLAITIKHGLEDALPAVRKLSRQCYTSFEQLHPQKAATMYHTLDSTTQKYLQQHTSNPRKDITRIDRTHPPMTVKNPTALTKQNIARPATTQQIRHPTILPTNNRLEGTPKSKTWSEQFKENKPPPGLPQSSKLHTTVVPYISAPKLARGTQIQQTGTATEDNFDNTFNHLIFVTKEMHTPKRVQQQQTPKSLLLPTPKLFSLPTPVFDLQLETEEEKIAVLLEKTESELWSTRMESFHNLHLVFRDNNKIAEGLRQAEKITNSCISHLGDTHYKVVSQVLQLLSTMRSLQASNPFWNAGHFLELLSGLLPLLVHPKEEIVRLAGDLVDEIVDRSEPSTIFPILFKIAEHPNPTAVLKSIDYITLLTSKCSSFLQHSTRMLFFLVFLKKSN